MKSVKQLIEEANSRVKTASVQEALGLMNDAETAFVDLRDSAELHRDGKIPGAVHVNRGMLEFALDPATPIRGPGPEPRVFYSSVLNAMLTPPSATRKIVDTAG
jgi:hypothetical protein